MSDTHPLQCGVHAWINGDDSRCIRDAHGLGGHEFVIDADAALVAERDKYRDALSGCIPWVAASGRGAAQEALAIACDLTGSDPFDWTAHPDVLVRRMELLGMPDRRAALRDDTAAVAPETPQERPWCECDPDYDGRCTDPCQLEARARAVPSGDAEEERYVDLTLRCPECSRRADTCFDHGDDWKKR